MNDTSTPSTIAANGIANTSTIERPMFWRSARIRPTTIVIGAAMAIVQAITMSICTCCTSLVMRVISDGAPNEPTSRAEKSVTWWKRLLAQVAAEAHRDLAAEVDRADREHDLDRA